MREFLTSFHMLMHFVGAPIQGKRSEARAGQMSQEETLGIQTGPCVCLAHMRTNEDMVLSSVTRAACELFEMKQF